MWLEPEPDLGRSARVPGTFRSAASTSYLCCFIYLIVERAILIVFRVFSQFLYMYLQHCVSMCGSELQVFLFCYLDPLSAHKISSFSFYPQDQHSVFWMKNIFNILPFSSSLGPHFLSLPPTQTHSILLIKPRLLGWLCSGSKRIKHSTQPIATTLAVRIYFHSSKNQNAFNCPKKCKVNWFEHECTETFAFMVHYERLCASLKVKCHLHNDMSL